MYYRIIPQSDELIHYGVMGMHWGIRRYQNYDGTRIGSGESPVTRPSKHLRNTVVGGQGGKATGTARLAAGMHNAKNNSSSDTKSDSESGSGGTDKKTNPWLKEYKSGKKTTTPAQETLNGIRDVSNSGQKLLNVAEKHDKRKTDSTKKQAKKAKEMSDEELRNSINRIKMEREYVSLTTKDTESGYDKAREILGVVGDVASVALSVLGILIAIKKLKGFKQDGMDNGTTFDELNDLLAKGNFDEEFVRHALDLDEEYIGDYLAHQKLS